MFSRENKEAEERGGEERSASETRPAVHRLRWWEAWGHGRQ